MRWLSVVCVALCALCVSATGLRTLVLLDNKDTKATHSLFFSALKARNHQLTFAEVASSDIALSSYGIYNYDNLVLFAPTAEELGEKINADAVVAFIDQGGNVLVAGDVNVTEPIREIANACGIDFDEEATAVVDHLSSDASDASGEHSLVVADQFVSSAVLLGKGPSAPVLFKGIGHLAPEGSSRLITKILTAGEGAYSAALGSKVTEYPQSTGRDTLLVTAVQARNNARAVFTGSLDLFSNKFFSSAVEVAATGKKYPKSGNEELATEVSKWVFQERGRLRASNLTHHNQNGIVNPQAYRVTDTVDFSVAIEEYDGATRQWVPYSATDVQLEFVMIDPYIRTTLKSNGKGVYSAKLVLPDVYGVFKFRINYFKQGYSNIELSQQVSVHPFRHNEFERFIDVAYPYYLSAFSVFGAFALFGVLFLYSS